MLVQGWSLALAEPCTSENFQVIQIEVKSVPWCIMKPLVLVFCKNALLGTVKTRLAKSIGELKALEVYQQLLQKTARTLQASDLEAAVWHTPSSQPDPLWLEVTSNCFRQVSGDLGQRMQAGFEWAFGQGYGPVVGIGTDLWDLEATDLEQAFELLQNKEVVIGPAADGGYYLIGMQKMQTQLFQNKAWSTPELLEQTLADIAPEKRALLSQKNDIDTAADLQKHPDLWALIE